MTEGEEKRSVIKLFIDESVQSEEVRARCGMVAEKYGLGLLAIPSGGHDIPQIKVCGVTYSYWNSDWGLERAIHDIESIYGPKDVVCADDKPVKETTA